MTMTLDALRERLVDRLGTPEDPLPLVEPSLSPERLAEIRREAAHNRERLRIAAETFDPIPGPLPGGPAVPSGASSAPRPARALAEASDSSVEEAEERIVEALREAERTGTGWLSIRALSAAAGPLNGATATLGQRGVLKRRTPSRSDDGSPLDYRLRPAYRA